MAYPEGGGLQPTVFRRTRDIVGHHSILRRSENVASNRIARKVDDSDDRRKRAGFVRQRANKDLDVFDVRRDTSRRCTSEVLGCIAIEQIAKNAKRYRRRDPRKLVFIEPAARNVAAMDIDDVGADQTRAEVMLAFENVDKEKPRPD